MSQNVIIGQCDVCLAVLVWPQACHDHPNAGLLLPPLIKRPALAVVPDPS